VLSINRKIFAKSCLILNLFASQIGEFFLPHPIVDDSSEYNHCNEHCWTVLPNECHLFVTDYISAFCLGIQKQKRLFQILNEINAVKTSSICMLQNCSLLLKYFVLTDGNKVTVLFLILFLSDYLY